MDSLLLRLSFWQHLWEKPYVYIKVIIKYEGLSWFSHTNNQGVTTFHFPIRAAIFVDFCEAKVGA